MPPSTITGSLHPSNRDAIAWNERGLVVFGCHSTLVFLDARRLNVFQTLEQHSTAINSVCWKSSKDLIQRNNSDSETNPRSALKCASSDISGNIIVWDVDLGYAYATFRHSNTQVTDLKWYHWPDNEKDLLLSLHSNTFLILWDVAKKERIWEHKFTVLLYKFSINPFDASEMALTSVGSSLLLIERLSPTRWAPTDSCINSITLEPRTISPTKITETSIVQLQYHAAYPQLLFVIFAKEICLVDTQHRQVIYSAVIDTGSPLVQMLPCAQRDALFLVHQNGLISFRLPKFHFSDERVTASLDYERACFTESLSRQSVRLRVMGAALCPSTQSTLCLLMNSGRLLIYQLENINHDIEPYRIRSIMDVVMLDNECQSQCEQLRLTQFGSYSSLSSTVTVVRMRPIGTTTDLTADSTDEQLHVKVGHLAAVGSSSGIVHLIDVFSGKIVRDFQLHTCPIKCLEWAGPNAIVSAAYIASLSSSNTVRNDLFITDISTGIKRRIRPEQEESPIEAIRVSYYSSYLAISFRHHPLEIWELGTQRLLRRMNKRCPVIVDMCWSGKHHQAKQVNEKTKIYRENLVVLDNDNHLYHVVVKGLHVRDGKEVSTQWKSGAAFLRCMVWKDDMLAFGDSAGRVGVWDLAKTQCRQSGLSQSTRGPVLRIVFSKLAGDYTLTAHYPTSLVVWDTDKLHAIFSVQRPGLSIIDIDMCGLTPVYISSDGMFRIALSNDTEKCRNISISESDMPLLLQTAYRDGLQTMVAENASVKVPDSIKDDPDFTYLVDRLGQFDSRLSRLAFTHQFAGDLTLANFCRISESCRNKSATTEDNSTIEQMPTDLLLFWPKNDYIKRMELMTRLLLSTCKNELQLEHAIEKCIIMKKNELAMYYLLNNEQQPQANATNREEIRLNAFRACILSASFDTEESKCLVKLTATNLIASNFVSEGIQLLSLIDQGLDACKYLISQALWQRSLSYAKMNPKCEFSEIYARYADYLLTDTIGRTSLALMIMASLGNWERCKTQLDSVNQITNRDALRQIMEIAEECTE